jgi:hypothetical protein
MKLPADTLIARTKLIGYLLRPLPENDKSGFLALAGYTPDNADELEADLRTQLLALDAEFVESTEYGDKYCIRGTLTGPNGQRLRIASFWMTENATGTTKFITLYPA